MSDEPGRGKFVDQAAEARPSVWRRTAGWIREEILHSLGRPARLEGAIASGQLIGVVSGNTPNFCHNYLNCP
ncbi:hypothetical protein FIX45_14090 [Salmonella enterica]|nr:hypothetical protein [Salmonella enterica]